MAESRHLPPARGDEDELFRAYNHDLMRSIATAVHVSAEQTVEDACAFAWAKFLETQPDRGRNWKGWLFRTAQRQAWLLEQRRDEQRCDGLRIPPDPAGARDAIELCEQ